MGRRLCVAMGLALAGLLLTAGAALAGEAELLRLLDRAEQQLAGVRDYTMTMFSRERVGEVLQPEERIFVKFQRPFRVYMRWQEGPSKGRESLYVAGAHNNKMLLYEPKGIQRLFTAAMEPTDKRVMEVSRHPITDMGIGRLLELVGDNTRRAARNGVLRMVDRGQTDVAGRRARQIEGILPQDPKAGYYAYRVIIAFDLENHLPIRVMVYDWQDRLVEDYTYADLQLNPGLNGRDFDPANIDYGFSSWRIPLSS